jgi:hypothetical protein
MPRGDNPPSLGLCRAPNRPSRTPFPACKKLYTIEYTYIPPPPWRFRPKRENLNWEIKTGKCVRKGKNWKETGKIKQNSTVTVKVNAKVAK